MSSLHPIVPRLILITLSVVAVYAQQEQEPNPLVQSTVRFTGNVSIGAADGTRREVPVTVRNWSVVGGKTIDRFADSGTGFVIVQLLAGQVTTAIDGKQQIRKTGDSWSVPAGSHMSLTVKREMATLQTLTAEK